MYIHTYCMFLSLLPLITEGETQVIKNSFGSHMYIAANKNRAGYTRVEPESMARTHPNWMVYKEMACLTKYRTSVSDRKSGARKEGCRHGNNKTKEEASPKMRVQ